MTARSYLPMTPTALAEQLVESWRGDFSEAGRYLKDIGVGGRTKVATDIGQVVERAAREQGEGSRG